ncbi:unnamed protein product [Peronospora belbahrii]|uniref:Secreted protein n=1 Tax=Peronospora belbahrii TaxID=622444 RepID=A0AAU9KZ87_9STRA|nr:unnamed protein product [Peronospora belbahrii]
MDPLALSQMVNVLSLTLSPWTVPCLLQCELILMRRSEVAHLTLANACGSPHLHVQAWLTKFQTSQDLQEHARFSMLRN